MITDNEEHIKASLACAHQLKASVCRTSAEFKHLRLKLLQSLQPTSLTKDFHRDENRDDRFQQVSDTMIDEHARMDRPALVVFGQNSSGKTSFIQRFIGIGNILPADFGRVTARIVQLTYAAGEQACLRVYETIEKVLVQQEGDLSHFFVNQLEPDWDGIANALLPYVKRPADIGENSPEFYTWAKCFVEVSLPSNILSLGIDVYDTPGFLSEDREKILTENLHDLVKRIKPTLVFLYENATIGDTDKSCFLAMKDAFGTLERVSTFFLNTKADCISIANDYLLDDDPENVPFDLFVSTLREKRQHCYELLRKRREMAGEALGSLPDSVDDCVFFDICTIPKDFDPWETYTNLINTTTFQRIVQFAVESYSAPTLVLAQDILTTVDDYFDLVASTTFRGPDQWNTLRQEAIEWGRNFFDEYEKILPNLTDQLIENILHLFEQLQPQITRQAALIKRTDDPIDSLLQDNAKSVRDYIRLAVQEQIVKVAANEVLITKREEIKAVLSNHFEQPRRLRKNELLSTTQRQVLGEISGRVLQQTTTFDTFLDNLIKIPMRCTRFWLSLPTRLSAYRKELYNLFVESKISDNDDDVYRLLDAMDAYDTLSNEEGRRKFADYCLTQLATEIKGRKDRFSQNLVAWVKEQQKAFNKSVQSNYQYITAHLPHEQTLHNLVVQYSGSFASIECQLLAAIELAKRNGVPPVIGVELGRGGFYSVHTAQWGVDNNLAVKKLLDSSNKNACMAALEAHHHRMATLLKVDHITPLLSVYENNINGNQRELWLIIPRYPQSLRQYLMQHIHEISFDRTISFALTIASALAELHRLEIIHRDIKASNVMLDDNEQCYLIDFGTVKLGLFAKTLIGTIPLPPEILKAYLEKQSVPVHYYGAAADVYSFGLLLYEMLPKPSYERLDNSTLSRIESLIRSTCEPDVIIKDYLNLIHQCLDQMPDKRPSALEVISRLRHLQQKTERKLCTICQEREREVRYTPCGHKITCVQCWQSWSAATNGDTRCILCKAIVIGQIHDDSNATFLPQPI